MKNYLFLPLLFIVSICKAEHKIKIYHEKTESGFRIYADNDEYCKMSMKIDFKLTNLNAQRGNNAVYVIEPQKKRQLITRLRITKKGMAYRFSFEYWSNYGDSKNDLYDENYIYDLPYNKSKTFKIIQGYNGDFSHQNINSLDFSMPVGTELRAIRGGIVIKVIDHNNKSCGNEECNKYNNIIIINHSDGTFAEYVHLKQNGSKVKVGDKIEKGQIIAHSGNVGWSTGPHLHLTVFKQKIFKRITLKTKFRIGNGDDFAVLNEKEKYLKNY